CSFSITMLYFFFQAEDGIRDLTVTGVQTCALPIWQHLARVGEQPLPVAVVDDPEGVVVAGPEQRHELLVGAETKERRGRVGPNRGSSPGYCCPCWECGRFHVKPVLTLTPSSGEGFGFGRCSSPR